jgi:hypothetical protein
MFWMVCGSFIDKPATCADLADRQLLSPCYPHQCLMFIGARHQYYTLGGCL